MAASASPTKIACAAPECANKFTPKRSTARYCGTTCRQRAARARKAVAAAEAADSQAKTADAEHGLVRATRKQLEEADALDTVDGQIALQLARKLADPDHVSSGLAKELRATLAAATGAKTLADSGGDGPPAPAPEDDEVTRARESRERKAREAAAGRA